MGVPRRAAVRGMGLTYRTKAEDAIRVARVVIMAPKCICHCPGGPLRARPCKQWHVGITMPHNPSTNRLSTPSKASGARPRASLGHPEQAHPQGATISPEDLAEFQRIYRKEYGVDLTPDEALIRGQQLVELFRILLRPPR